MHSFFLLGLLIIFITGCFRPHYERPKIHAPETWRLQINGGSTLCNFRWWEQFQDPVLDQLIIRALHHNYDLKVAIARVFEYYARFGIVRSELYPTINANGIYTRTEASLEVPLPPPPQLRTTNDYELFLNLSWELDFWGRIYSATEASYAEMLSQVQARRAVVMTVVSAVATSYIRLRQLDAQFLISKKTLDSRLESLKLAQIRFSLGETSEMEVKQAESEVEIAAIAMIAFEREIPKEENLLSILLGENPHAIMRGRTIEAFQYPPTIPAGIPSDVLTRRPDIVEAEDILIAANARITEARALLFPQITLTGLYGWESDHLSRLVTSPAEMWQYGISAVQYIFDAGRRMYGIYEAEEVANEALYTYIQTILTAFREVDDALITYRKDRELVNEHQRQVAILIDYLRLVQLRYREGEVDYLNVLDAERSLFNAQLDTVQAQADSFIAVVQLYNALGGGWVIDADEIALGSSSTFAP